MSTNVFKISLCYDEKWEIKYVSQLISIIDFKTWYEYSCFQNSLCYDEKWEIKLCMSVNTYCRLPKLGMSTHFCQNKPVL